MRLSLVAVGQRQPAWADEACADYLKRFPPDWRVELKAVKAEPRNQGKTVEAMKAAEAERLAAACPKGARRVVLDERGQRLTTQQLAERLRAWQHDGRDVVLLIGGPDGLDDTLKVEADEALRLSDLTLPHALARVLLAEALYRAWSLHAGHPYHRE
ncbi:MAG TPA: 23S rRNA (pseudouridine(1915)-N(3))-methyltransferase RlmH [Methylibium sp.]|nr:23S rRNA (pseudouridine(1915)-N(3))-methyltransferase RlmH [Methylibium sp.]